MNSLLEALATQQPDIDVSYDPTGYKEQPEPRFRPLAPGNYRVKIAAADVKPRTDRSGQVVTNDGWPKLVIEKFTVVEGGGWDGRKVVAYYDVFTKPYDRGGVQASNLIDWCRAYDATVGTLGSRDQQLKTLFDFLQDERELVVRTGLEAYDKAFIEAIKSEGGTPTKDEYGKARIKKGFDEFGRVLGNTGEELEGKVVITQFYSSLQAPGIRLAKAS